VLFATAALAVTTFAVPIAAAPSASASISLHGEVLTNATPLAAYDVSLWATNGSGAPGMLGTATTDGSGVFDIAYDPPADPSSVLYVVAHNTVAPPPVGAITLVNVLGPGNALASVVVNERTTVAAAYAMSQFASNGTIAGLSPGLQNAAGMAANLADPTTGGVSSVLANAPNGGSALSAFNSLANMVARCIATPIDCAALFTLATPPGGAAPSDTFQALVNVNHNPWQNVAGLHALSLLPPAPYAPALVVAPDAWTLALRFVGDGVSMDGPGNMVVDHLGNLWVTNNYEFSPGVLPAVCGARNVLKFTPSGQYAPGSPFTGGGLSGAGFGITLDPFGDVWVANFGFAAPPPDCPETDQPPHNSVSQFHPDGTPVSPAATSPNGDGGGWTQGGISFPQGTVSEPSGSIWIANCGANSVTVYPGGNPGLAHEIKDIGVVKPFAIAIGDDGDTFVTGSESNTVAVLGPDGAPVAGSPVPGGGLNRPLGVAADSGNNAWVANSGLIDLPCPLVDTTVSAGSITFIPDGALGSPVNFTGGGITIPWGITTDGDDNVWVANFGGKRLSQFCGTNTAACPPGFTAGQAISPAITGYGFDGLVRNTGVVVDQAGNVWLANNWKEVPIQTNPGGYELVAFVGMAAPVQVAPPRPRPQQVLRFTG
jgi:hypothetical protein